MTTFEPRIDLGTLNPGKELGDGGQGTVYALNGSPEFVLKRYKPTANPHGNGIDRLVTWRARLSPADRDLIDRCFAWPRSRVIAGRSTVGAILPIIPSRFWVVLPGNERKPLEVQWAYYPDRARQRGLAVPTGQQRVELCRLYAGAMATLHRNDVVYGDVSFRNLLWTIQPEAAVYYIDCDSVSLAGGRPVVPTGTTLGWTDPTLAPEAPQDVQSDRYKLGLAIYRIIYTEPKVPSTRLQGRVAPVVDLVPLLNQALFGDRANRPTASEWEDVLLRAKYVGRTGSGPSVPPPPSRTSGPSRSADPSRSSSRSNRGTIPVGQGPSSPSNTPSRESVPASAGQGKTPASPKAGSGNDSTDTWEVIFGLFVLFTVVATIIWGVVELLQWIF